MKFNKILTVFKKTKFELDFESFKDLTLLKKFYSLQNNCYDIVYSSHLRQLESREQLKKCLPESEFIFRQDLPHKQLSGYDLVIAHGGDNHFTYVAHFVGETPILGCNSDPQSSSGALLNFDAETLGEALHSMFKNSRIEQWTLIDCSILHGDGRIVSTVPCISEVSIRNQSPDLISRYLIQAEGNLEEQKSSGLLLYTGAGSTGWPSSCKSDFSETRDIFHKEEKYFRVLSRELSHKDRKNYKLSDFSCGTELEVISEMDGGISVDSLKECIYGFPPGAKAVFRISDKSLKVVSMNSENLSYKTKKSEDVNIIEFHGRLDETSADKFRKDFDTLDPGKGNLVFNFSQLKYISSSGIRILFELKNLMERTGRKFIITEPSENVKKIFNLLELWKSFLYKESDKEGISEIKNKE